MDQRNYATESYSYSLAAIAMLVDPPIGSTMIGEEHQTRMITLWCATKQVERGIVVEQEVLRVSCLRANDIRSLNWVAAEEDGKVQANDIIVAFASVELYGEATRISCFVWKLACWIINVSSNPMTPAMPQRTKAHELVENS